MRGMMIVAVACFGLIACSGDDDPRPVFGVPVGGPGDVLVEPVNPLVLPQTFVLPSPTPGGRNRALPF